MKFLFYFGDLEQKYLWLSLVPFFSKDRSIESKSNRLSEIVSNTTPLLTACSAAFYDLRQHEKAFERALSRLRRGGSGLAKDLSHFLSYSVILEAFIFHCPSFPALSRSLTADDFESTHSLEKCIKGVKNKLLLLDGSLLLLQNQPSQSPANENLLCIQA